MQAMARYARREVSCLSLTGKAFLFALKLVACQKMISIAYDFVDPSHDLTIIAIMDFNLFLDLPPSLLMD